MGDDDLHVHHVSIIADSCGSEGLDRCDAELGMSTGGTTQMRRLRSIPSGVCGTRVLFRDRPDLHLGFADDGSVAAEHHVGDVVVAKELLGVDRQLATGEVLGVRDQEGGSSVRNVFDSVISGSGRRRTGGRFGNDRYHRGRGRKGALQVLLL